MISGFSVSFNFLRERILQEVKVTVNWLKEFLDTDEIDAKNIAQLLTMSGTEVKKIEYIGEKYKGIVVGKVIEYSLHPNADKLFVCKVDIGNKILNIVCGAKNFKIEDKVAVALEGARVDNIVIKKSKLRGVFSEGMMCSEMELGISLDASGIMILSKDYKVGSDFAKSVGLDDISMELEITPNRPDCLSIIGIAREISAIKNIDLIVPQYDWLKEININSDIKILVKDYSLCPRYSAKVFYNIPDNNSPMWLRNRLNLCDVRPVNLVVDLTNYVMIETGQPLHAFDKDMLYSSKIIIREAEEGEKIKTIDDNDRKLEKGMLLIADEKNPIAIAGVMGGKETEINTATKNILLESANFNGPSIMRTSKKIGLRTEASNRFEKKLDPMMTIFAIKRFEYLLKRITNCDFGIGIYDNSKEIKRQRKINLRLGEVKKILGKDIGKDNISNILTGLKIENKIKGNIIESIVPSFRFEDLGREIDLIEEVARIYGYNNFDSTPPDSILREGGYSFYQRIVRDVRAVLCNIGLYEVINYSFVSEELKKKFKLDFEDAYKNTVKVLNPINEDFAYLRSSLLPSMTMNIKDNINRKIKDIRIYEISKVFRKKLKSKLPLEINTLGIMLTGKVAVKNWYGKGKNCNYYSLKGILEYLYNKYYNLGSLDIKEKEYKFFHPRISADVVLNNEGMGIIGKVHPILLEEMDIKQDVYYLEINLDKFIENIKIKKQFKSVPVFPSIEIDLAIVVDENVKSSNVEKEIRNTETEILEEITLFDIYRGEQIKSGKKSLAYSLVFRDNKRTLKDVEVEIIIQRILENLGKKYNARVRDF
jgi:phenylalanyl-tRNA synthetase beta chain